DILNIMKMKEPSRRNLLSLGAGLAALTGCSTSKQETPTLLGTPPSKYGARSPHETAVRLVPAESKTPSTGASRTPLQDTYGIITPSSLHFERHHAGVPTIDPTQHELLLHGLVERPLRFSMVEL